MGEFGPNHETNQEILARSLERINEFLNDWNDDIPEKILHSTSENNKFKVRKGWFSGILGEINLLRLSGLLSEPEKEAIDKFYHDYSGDILGFTGRLTTAEDIERGNEVLLILKQAIESKLQLENDAQ